MGKFAPAEGHFGHRVAGSPVVLVGRRVAGSPVVLHNPGFVHTLAGHVAVVHIPGLVGRTLADQTVAGHTPAAGDADHSSAAAGHKIVGHRVAGSLGADHSLENLGTCSFTCFGQWNVAFLLGRITPKFLSQQGKGKLNMSWRLMPSKHSVFSPRQEFQAYIHPCLCLMA